MNSQKVFREISYYTVLGALLTFSLLIAALAIWYLLPSPTTWEIVLGEVSEFPPAERPHRVSATSRGQSLHFWVVNVDDQLIIFDRRNPGRLGYDRWRCQTAWEEVNGHIIDPCSGDKYFLNGEPWEDPEGYSNWVNFSDRALDRFTYTINDGKIILGERVLGAQVSIDREIYCLQWPRECR